MIKGALTPLKMMSTMKGPNRRLRRCNTILTDSLLESGSYSTMVW